MVTSRGIIKSEFDDMEEIDTKENLKHKPRNFERRRKRLPTMGEKVQIWVKKETLEYEK